MSADKTPSLPDKQPGGYAVAGSLQALCESVALKLREHELVAEKGIRILPEYAGDLFNRLNQVLNAKLSVLAVVGIEKADARTGGMQAAFRNVNLRVLCYENVLFNQGGSGSKVGALTLAELACGWLHNTTHGAQQLWMQEDNACGINEERTDPDKGLICYHARFFILGCPRTSFE